MSVVTTISKMAVYTLLSVNSKKENMVPRWLFFAIGIGVEDLYLNKKGTVLEIFNNSRENEHLQNFVFSSLLETFLNSLVFDSTSYIKQDLIDIAITYALTIPTLLIENTDK